MKRTIILGLAASVLVLAAMTGCVSDAPASPPEVTPTPEVTPSPTPTPETPSTDDPAPTDSPTPANDPASDKDTLKVLEAVLLSARESLGEDVIMPMTFNDPITADNCEGTLGITAEQFAEHVADAYAAKAAIGTFAFEVALVKCADAKSASEMKKLAADHYDHNKWICVIPEQCFVVESGNFVLLGAVADDFADAIIDGFSFEFEGNIGSVNKFYERGEDQPSGDGGGGGLLMIP